MQQKKDNFKIANYVILCNWLFFYLHIMYIEVKDLQVGDEIIYPRYSQLRYAKVHKVGKRVKVSYTKIPTFRKSTSYIFNKEK